MGEYMNQSIKIIVDRVNQILNGNELTIYLFGSVALDDFKLGWSDIDILILTEKIISTEEAEELVNLRQVLLIENPNNIYFKLFEGGILSIDAFLNNKKETAVYWGTSGQRITDSYSLDVFSMMELIDWGVLLCGNDIRKYIKYPDYDNIVKAVKNHYHTICQYAAETGGNLYSAGWMLDIARCLYTLSERKIISKTKAGYWAIENGLVPNVIIMDKVMQIRENPLKYKYDVQTQEWLSSLEIYIHEFAEVLNKKLNTLKFFL